jgi:RNA polymerase sigma factor (TIGR02999 family)
MEYSDTTSGESEGALRSLLARAASGEPRATEELLPLVYDHLRVMARVRLAGEAPGQTLQPTALVHEAYLKLVGSEHPWTDKKHFFAAAALAMRRILVDRARAKRTDKRGGGAARTTLDAVEGAKSADGAGRFTHAPTEDSVDWVRLEEAMKGLEKHDPGLAEIVHLRYFAGLTLDETALAMGVSSRTVNREWLVARAWLLRRMQEHRA